MSIYLYIHETLGYLLGLNALFLRNSFRKELQIHIVSHSLHMSVLPAAEYTSRTSYLKVAESYSEAASELGELPHGVQSLRSYLRKDFITLIGEIRIAPAVRAPHSSAELIQLRKSEAVGVLDDKGIYVRHVHACLYDSGAHEDIHLMFHQLLPYIGHLVLAHLSVSYSDSRLGKHFLQTRSTGTDSLHAVVYVVDLSSAAELPYYSLNYRTHVVLYNVGLHGISVLWRLLYDRHIAYAAHCHIQCTGYGSCREHEHIDSRKALLEALLMSHAEALLLVDYGKSEVLEHH